MAEAQAMTLEFVAKHCPERKVPLCGNTIGQDRRFLIRYMPRLHDYFHYRSIDVSTVKELVQRWYPGSAYKYDKAKEHEAMNDIRESVAELAFYRENFFRKP
jgi:oligoribonuclease